VVAPMDFQEGLRVRNAVHSALARREQVQQRTTVSAPTWEVRQD